MMVGNPTMILLKKELMEQMRTYKILIVGAVFLFFGLMSPLTAKFMPDIVEMVGVARNISLQLPEPTVSDAHAQYIKNISQLCTFILIFIFMGSVAQEKEKRSVEFLLVKPVKRTTFIAAKYVSHAILVWFGITVSFLIGSLYIAILFGNFDLVPFIKVNAILFLYIVVTTSATICFSTILKSQVGAGIAAFVAWIILSLASNIQHIGKYFPGKLIEESSAAGASMTPMWQPFLGAIFFIAVFVVAAIFSFRRWEAS